MTAVQILDKKYATVQLDCTLLKLHRTRKDKLFNALNDDVFRQWKRSAQQEDRFYVYVVGSNQALDALGAYGITGKRVLNLEDDDYAWRWTFCTHGMAWSFYRFVTEVPDLSSWIFVHGSI